MAADNHSAAENVGVANKYKRIRPERTEPRRSRGGRVRASRIHVFEREPYELRQLTNALLSHFGFDGFNIQQAPATEWSRQLQESLSERNADVYYVIRPPEGQEILPRALCFAVGTVGVAAVVRRLKANEEEELSAVDGFAHNAVQRGQRRAAIEDHLPVAPAAGSFVGSDEIVLTAADGDEMWRKICQWAGVNQAAVGGWGVIDRSVDRSFSVRQVHGYRAPSTSANIDGLRRAIGNDNAEVWEIETLGTIWCVRIAAINHRTRAVMQVVRR